MCKLVIPDHNAPIAKKSTYFEQVPDRHKVCNVTNNNEQKLCNIASATCIVISTTK